MEKKSVLDVNMITNLRMMKIASLFNADMANGNPDEMGRYQNV